MGNNFSFSIPPKNKDYKIAVTKLREHSTKTGISFSFLVANAIKRYVEERNL